MPLFSLFRNHALVLFEQDIFDISIEPLIILLYPAPYAIAKEHLGASAELLNALLYGATCKVCKSDIQLRVPQ